MEAAEQRVLKSNPSARRSSPLSPVLAACLILLAGCCPESLRNRHALFTSQTPTTVMRPTDGALCGDAALAQRYRAAGADQEARHIEGCVDQYYRAAIHAWRHMESASATQSYDSTYQAAWVTYQQSLGRLMATAAGYGRLDPRGRLIVADGASRRAIPIRYEGFAWRPSDFCQVLPAQDFVDSDIERYHNAGGLGVSLVAVRHAGCREVFHAAKQPFPVTAVLRPVHREDGPPEPCDAELTFRNPYVVDSVYVGSAIRPMARDLSAPLGYLLRESPRRFTEGFLSPDDSDTKPKLIMMEPYQRGKIPVVFIHGLWSDPMTWIDTVNDLLVQGDLYRQYQFWFFQYPTGGELIESAAELREKLLLARDQFDPRHEDRAMDRMVLVGHSMGGLVAQLQITYSLDILWRHAADQPLEAVRTTPRQREQLRRMFFFDPSPLVRRVVFIGTPHRGSGMSRRLIGRVASSLVRYSPADKDHYRQLMDDNTDIFKEYLWGARPTTVDLLEPSNPMLLAMGAMPLSRCVRMHSIIGTSRTTWTGEASDGVVSLSSARQAGVSSELHIETRHEKLHRDPACVAELMRIMRLHGQEPSFATAR